jgi:exodeoxyribonuclease VII small subunit
MANLKFEDAMARLEEIVNGLEKGDLSLDKSLKMFEEGVRLSKGCLKMLNEAQQKVEILVRDKDGKKKIRHFRLEEAGGPLGDTDDPPGEMEIRLEDTGVLQEETDVRAMTKDEEENE